MSFLSLSSIDFGTTALLPSGTYIKTCHADGLNERGHSFPGVPVGAEYVNFKVADTKISMGNIGGPGWRGVFESDPATIEFSSNVPISVQYQTGQNLRSPSGDTLPTSFSTRFKGTGLINNRIFAFPKNYGLFLDLGGPQSQGYIIYAPGSVVKGLQFRVRAVRNGVNDPAGIYTTNIILNWCKL